MKFFSPTTNLTLRPGRSLLLTLPLPVLPRFLHTVIIAAAPFLHHLLFMATHQTSVHLTLPLLLHLHMLKLLLALTSTHRHHLQPICVSLSLQMASLRALNLALALAH